MPCKVHNDKGGESFLIEGDWVTQKLNAFPKSVKRSPSAPLCVWWDRMKDERLLVRQENTEDRADLLILTPGQAYDLLDALNRALGISTGPEINGVAI